MSTPDSVDLDEQIEIAAGRRAPYSQLGDWVALSGISNQAKALYWHLAMHVNQQRGDTEVWPTRLTLSDLMHFSKAESVDRYVGELKGIGAVEVVKRRTAGGMRTRNRYIVNQTPADEYAGPRSLKDYYERRRAEMATNESAGQPVVRSSGPREAAKRETAGQPVVRSSGPRSPVQRTSVVRCTGLEQDEVLQQEEPPPARTRARAGARGASTDRGGGGASTVGDDVVDQVLARIGSGWRLTPKQRRRLVAPIRDVVARGWRPVELGDQLGANPDGVRAPYAVLRSRLSELAETEPPPSRPTRPPHCGVCVDATRHRETADGRPYPCPDCHPDPARRARGAQIEALRAS